MANVFNNKMINHNNILKLKNYLIKTIFDFEENAILKRSILKVWCALFLYIKI